MRTPIVPVGKLRSSQRDRMYRLMLGYYDGVTREQFDIDLDEKDDVILLLSRDGEIQGFSTLLHKEMVVEGRRIYALYSGDTVLEREYWGNGALAKAFGNYLVLMKFKYPLTPVYWFLISKGYKTYLLMTNNFRHHYPRFERETPPWERSLMKQFYMDRFGKSYDGERGVIDPRVGKTGEASIMSFTMSLKVEVADIDTDLLKHPRIGFFAERNPRWNSGVELACVAKVTLEVPIAYSMKYFRKMFKTLVQRLSPWSQPTRSFP